MCAVNERQRFVPQNIGQPQGAVEMREQLIDAMVTNPKLIERPIVFANGRAALGRPPENVLAIL
jgi:arsenate reductase-like glutaredoxin family protein